MGISFENISGLYEKALTTRLQRSEVLANNIANADTPGYKARDIDFRSVMAGVARDQLPLEKTDKGHIAIGQGEADGRLMYRNPIQPSIDGNTVDTQTEIVEFSRNALEYQASFQFLNSRFTGVKNALKGE